MVVESVYFGILWSLFVTVYAGEYCFSSSYGYTSYMYCSSSCCGDSYNRYCCGSNVGVVVGIVLGVLCLVAIIVSVLVAVFCCCRKTRGQTGQVCQPAGVTTTTVPVYGLQTTTVTAGYGQLGYTNAAYPQQMQASNIPADNGPEWQEAPPAYTAAVST